MTSTRTPSHRTGHPADRGSAPPRVADGVPVGQEGTVVRLYRHAFAAKLTPGLGAPDRADAVLRDGLDPARFLCAVDPDGAVVGAVGHHLGGRAAVDVRYRTLVRHHSAWSAPWRAALLLPLHRDPAPGELLLDGIAVDPQARGRGTGTRLLAAAADLARRHGLRRVRLSVVDTNPRARALYERCGYVATATTALPVLGPLYGFHRATTMTLDLAGGAR